MQSEESFNLILFFFTLFSSVFPVRLQTEQMSEFFDFVCLLILGVFQAKTVLLVYYESFKRELKTKPINECR